MFQFLFFFSWRKYLWLSELCCIYVYIMHKSETGDEILSLQIITLFSASVFTPVFLPTSCFLIQNWCPLCVCVGVRYGQQAPSSALVSSTQGLISILHLASSLYNLQFPFCLPEFCEIFLFADGLSPAFLPHKQIYIVYFPILIERSDQLRNSYREWIYPYKILTQSTPASQKG